VTAQAETSEQPQSSTYELFIGALSILSIVNLAGYLLRPDTPFGQVALLMDWFLSIIFLADFAGRLFTAESKRGYFIGQWGWVDLLSSLPLPQFKILRVTRIVRVVRLMRRYGPRRMVREFVENRAQSALLTLLLMIILVLEFGGYLMYLIESKSPGANIITAEDSIWYTFVTITTVGYGDRYPVTTAGRLIGMVIMVAGVGLFGTLTGYLANAFLAPKTEPAPEATVALAPTDPRSKLAEVRELVSASKSSQEALEAKLAELEALLPLEPPAT
jgi:voltage-gated potassium channel